MGGKLGRLSPLPCHHPRSLRPRTLRHCRRRIVVWIGRGCWSAGPQCRGRSARTSAVPLSRFAPSTMKCTGGTRGKRTERPEMVCTHRALEGLVRLWLAGQRVLGTLRCEQGGQPVLKVFSLEAHARRLPLHPWRAVIALMMSRGDR